MPAKWLTMAVAGVALLATAAVGGLEPAEAAPVQELAEGEPHRGPMVSLTLQRAVLIDTFPEAGASADPEADERVLAVVADVENVSARPVHSLNDRFREVLRLDALPELPLEGAARIDDGTIGPILQPGVPAELVLSWVVPADAFVAGEELELSLFDHELLAGRSLTFGEYWGADPALAAHVTLTVDDVGAGADAEQP